MKRKFKLAYETAFMLAIIAAVIVLIDGLAGIWLAKFFQGLWCALDKFTVAFVTLFFIQVVELILIIRLWAKKRG